MTARTRLRSTCQPGTEDAERCARRLVKLTNGPRIDDWAWEVLPPYTTIVAMHEEELRRRHAPRVYEEYVIGAVRYLAEQADRGAISPEQLASATNEAWAWMLHQMRSEALLLVDGVRAAEEADARAWQTVNALAGALATVLTVAIIASAASATAAPAPAPMTLTPPPTPSPTFCQAIPSRNWATGQVMSVNIYCR